MPKHEMTWQEAIIKVLQGSTEPLHATEIAERIKSDGLRQSMGATPEATVGAQIYTSIKIKGTKSPFIKVAKQTFALNPDSSASASIQSCPVQVLKPQTIEEDATVVTSFGMFWQRSAVEWKAKTKLLGQQANADQSVDFGEQSGIYCLYDGRELIYVGRATDQPLGKRLFQHTTDRLAMRWDRFSWFGLRPVSESGKLGVPPDVYSSNQIISVLEALLIEATEPRQNRKAGDDWIDKEYMQVVDPAIKKAQVQAIIAKL